MRELADEALVYDLESHRAICLNRAARSVWKHCDGRTNVAGLVRRLREEAEGPADESVVWLALEQLGRNNLLSERVRRPLLLKGRLPVHAKDRRELVVRESGT